MLSQNLRSIESKLYLIRGLLPYETAKALLDALSTAQKDALALEAQVVPAETRALPYPDNVINIAAILHRHGVTAGLSTSSNDGGAA